MRLNFNELKTSFSPMTHSEQSGVIGGNYGIISDDNLKRLFNYDAIGGFDSDLAKMFNNEVRRLSETEAGNGVVYQMLGKIGDSITDQIKLTQTNSGSNSSSKANYKYSSNEMDLYNLIGSDLSNSFEAGIVFQAVSHEMFHAYKDIVKGVGSDDQVTRELDANLFAAFVEKQTDQLHGTEYYYTGGFQFVHEDPDTTNPSQKAFQLAWDNIITYNDFSLNNYNTLIQNFQGSKFNTGGVYNSLQATTVPTFLYNDIAIFTIFYAYYGMYNNTGVGPSGVGNPGSGGGGGGGGESSPGVYNPLDGSWGGSNGGYDPGYGYNGGYNGGNSGSNTNPSAPPGNGQTYNNGPGGGQTGYGGETYPPAYYPPGYFESHDSSSF